MPEPNDVQRTRLAKLREQFGRDVIKGHAADAASGVMRVDAKCIAGVWVWYFDSAGEYRGGHLTGRLFIPEPPTHKPRNAIDN